jgi:hypothetical protein
VAAGGETDGAPWRWYFQERLGRPVPDDLAAYAARFGLGDPGALLRAVRLEHWYGTVRHR